MKKYFSLLFFILFTHSIFAQQKIKVACIGNSITAGSGVKDPKNFYPTQLQNMLGDNYEVQNFGLSGRTLLKHGDRPYWAEKTFATAKEFQPDIVIIMLGTNDTKPQNWKYGSEFESDYKAFIQEFKSLDSKPKIWICYPVPIFENRYNISETVLTGEVIPKIKKIAKSEKVKTINIYKGLQGFQNHIPDGVHPDDIGAGQIAKTVWKAIHRYRPKMKLSSKI